MVTWNLELPAVTSESCHLCYIGLILIGHILAEHEVTWQARCESFDDAQPWKRGN